MYVRKYVRQYVDQWRPMRAKWKEPLYTVWTGPQNTKGAKPKSANYA